MTNDAEEKNKILIKIEAIKTPLGPVPTLESFKRIVEGLNILNADMMRTQETVNSEVFKQMAGIEKELKSLRKLISEEIISFGAIKEDIVALNKRLDKIGKEQNTNMKNLSNLITDFIGSVRVFQDKITRILKKS
ncbi:MAG: hypothetical protein HWN66_12650 [Candidatus Helarchaeota archaeon]|nr:hypothetical protein [Candidatus Helarchaeota archaeon]